MKNLYNIVFIHSSIKTRIETEDHKNSSKSEGLFLYIVPLKQGLKLQELQYANVERFRVFIHSSIKTRIETSRF